jgi:hypothetical protein
MAYLITLDKDHFPTEKKTKSKQDPGDEQSWKENHHVHLTRN